ncbi:acyloxyacyl hydrolase [Alteromonas sediminis]|uniref:Lipid A deacylase n=1 Tax=Alteromonas sediminis TaxID=2259342 RepID=A0A3N5Y3E3_9ALTE|nr:acyloxyacyl hydrolase [Alteromonas sediminis]
MVILIIFITVLYSGKSSADNGVRQAVAIDYLHGEGDLSGVRLAYRPYTVNLKEAFLMGDVDIYWEVSINFWEFGENNQHETNYAIALSPVFSWHLMDLSGKYPLDIEFGIGLSLVEDTRFAGKDIGSHYQFEDRLGFTLAFGDELEHAASLRYMHYSNGGLNDKNPGMDFLTVSYVYHY